MRRPETSAALAAAVERATAKDPADRYPDMNAFLRDLEGALEVEVSRAGRSTGEATTVLDSVPRKRRRLLDPPADVLGGRAAADRSSPPAAIAFAALTGDEGPSRKAPAESESGGDPIEVACGDRLRPGPGGDGEEHEDEVDGSRRRQPRRHRLDAPRTTRRASTGRRRSASA